MKTPRSPMVFDCHNGEECYVRLDYGNAWYLRGRGEARIGRRLKLRTGKWRPDRDRNTSAENLLAHAGEKGWTQMGGYTYLPPATEFADLAELPQPKGKSEKCDKCKGHGNWVWIKDFWFAAENGDRHFYGQCDKCGGEGWL